MRLAWTADVECLKVNFVFPRRIDCGRIGQILQLWCCLREIRVDLLLVGDELDMLVLPLFGGP